MKLAAYAAIIAEQAVCCRTGIVHDSRHLFERSLHGLVDGVSHSAICEHPTTAVGKRHFLKVEELRFAGLVECNQTGENEA